MQKRNPLFVAGFPYGLLVIGYYVLLFLDAGKNGEEIPASAMFPLIGALVMVLVGAGYSLYWMITTARVLRRETQETIPYSILLIIPFANYWWMWRYGKAAEMYTGGKSQAALTFVLLIMLGPIGMGILQDNYNKLPKNAASPEA